MMLFALAPLCLLAAPAHSGARDAGGRLTPRRDAEPREARPGGAQHCGRGAYAQCKHEADVAFQACDSQSLNCSSICGPVPTALCQQCQSHHTACLNAYNATLATCGSCPEGLSCVQDISTSALYGGYDYCCPPGLSSCSAECLDPTCHQARQLFDTQTCVCRCQEPYVAQSDGTCVCPAVHCPPGRVVDDSCQCAKCPDGTLPCGNACVDLNRDPNHCGRCDVACPASKIQCCAGTCVSFDEFNHCGNCNISCGAGVGYSKPACCRYLGDPQAPYGQCVDLDSNTDDCGSCLNPCKPGHVCSNGKCQCPYPQTDCNGQCFNLQTDAKHCGSCTNQCPNGQSCQGGQCVCPSGQTKCGPICCASPNNTCCAGACFNGQTDVHHCGTLCMECGNLDCTNGVCTCPTNRACPTGSCCPPDTPLCTSAPWRTGGYGCCPSGLPVDCAPTDGTMKGHCKAAGSTCP